MDGSRAVLASPPWPSPVASRRRLVAAVAASGRVSLLA